MPTIRCEDCNAVLVGGSCVICGWSPRPVQAKRQPTLPTFPLSDEQVRSNRASAAALIETLIGNTPEPKADPIAYHAKRFQARGLEESAAYMQARALVEDLGHVEHCEVCQATPDPGRILRAKREETMRLYLGGQGMLTEAMRSIKERRRR